MSSKPMRPSLPWGKVEEEESEGARVHAGEMRQQGGGGVAALQLNARGYGGAAVLRAREWNGSAQCTAGGGQLIPR